MYLADKTYVTVDGVRVNRVYGGMYEGLPDKEMNDRIIAEAQTSFEKEWGKRRVHVVDPPRREPKIMGYDKLPQHMQDRYPNAERIPDYQYQVWLTSFTTFNEDDDGTELVLVFYVDKSDFLDKTLTELLQEATTNVVWKDVARGFGF